MTTNSNRLRGEIFADMLSERVECREHFDDEPKFPKLFHCDGEHDICAENLSDDVRLTFADMIKRVCLSSPPVRLRRRSRISEFSVTLRRQSSSGDNGQMQLPLSTLPGFRVRQSSPATVVSVEFAHGRRTVYSRRKKSSTRF